MASHWADVEFTWALAYAYLLAGKNDVTAFTEYYNLRDWRKRRKQFLEQAKKHGVSAKLRHDGSELYDEFEGAAFARNRIVHGNWAWSEMPGHEHSIFLAQARSVGVNVNRVFTGMIKIRRDSTRYPEVSVDFNRGPYEEWMHDDFENAIRDIIAYRDKVMDYGNRVLAHSLRAFSTKLTRQ